VVIGIRFLTIFRNVWCASGAFYPTFTFCERLGELVCAVAAKCKRVAAIFLIPRFEKQFQAQSMSIIADFRPKK
jgi:hypothetical protein